MVEVNLNNVQAPVSGKCPNNIVNISGSNIAQCFDIVNKL